MIDFLNRIKNVTDELPVKKKRYKDIMSQKVINSVIDTLENKPNITADELSSVTGYQRQYMVRVAKKLFDEGIVLRDKDPSDLYSYIYRLKR